MSDAAAELRSRRCRVPAGPWDGAGLWAGSWTTSSTGRPSRGAPTSPPTGPVIFAGNHISFLDGPVMFGASPRPMHILVKKEMFTGFLGRVLRASGQLPVDRAGDRAALQLSKAVLDAGRCVGILPEGTRGSGEGSRHQQRRRLARAELRRPRWCPWPSWAPGSGRRAPGHGSPPGPAGCTSASAKPLSISRNPGETGRASMDRAGTEIRAALAGHVQNTIHLSGQPLPDADSPQERHQAVAGTPADHH